MNERVVTLKTKLKKQKIKGLALDIDETISSTGEYWVYELEKRFGVNPEGLSAIEIIKKYTVIQNAPYWQTKEALDWMDKARLDNNIYLSVPLIENSNHFANKLNSIVPIVAYVTVRPNASEKVTEKWLKKHDFPKAEILTRPDKVGYERSHEWKAEVLAYLYPQVLGIVDDNPVILDYLPKNYKGYVFVFGKQFEYSGKLNVITCETWKDVLKSALTVFAKPK